MQPLKGARVLALLGDSITTDHISPAGTISPDTPAGVYLVEHGVPPPSFNPYGSRRGDHEVMVRDTFANMRLWNQLGREQRMASPATSRTGGSRAVVRSRSPACPRSARARRD